jgi:TonB family protein
MGTAVIVLSNTSCVTHPHYYHDIHIEKFVTMASFKATVEAIGIQDFGTNGYDKEVVIGLLTEDGQRVDINERPATKEFIGFAHSLHKGRSYTFPQIYLDYQTLGEISGPFKAYDRAFRNSIMQSWYTLLEKNKIGLHKNGKVVLQFHLNSDGSVTEMRVLEDGVGDEQVAVCQKAVSSAAPFPRWPEGMKLTVGETYRTITYTFNYYK